MAGSIASGTPATRKTPPSRPEHDGPQRYARAHARSLAQQLSVDKAPHIIERLADRPVGGRVALLRDHGAAVAAQARQRDEPAAPFVPVGRRPPDGVEPCLSA